MLKEAEQKSFQQICSIKILIQIFSHLWSAVANIKIVISRKKWKRKVIMVYIKPPIAKIVLLYKYTFTERIGS